MATAVNRRGFISLLAGAAGASLVPWRLRTDRLISLPQYPRLITAFGGEPPYAYQWTWMPGGSGLVISREAAATLPGEGTAEVLITDSIGRVASASVRFSVTRDPPEICLA